MPTKADFPGQPIKIASTIPLPASYLGNRRYREFPNCTGGNMSITSSNPGMGASARPKITTTTIQEKKQRREFITRLTAYDYPTARLVDESGIYMILGGDSLAQVGFRY